MSKLWSIKYTAANGKYMNLVYASDTWYGAVALLYKAATLENEYKPKSILDIISVEETT